MRASGRPTLLLGRAGLGFVGLGLPGGLLGVPWPSIRADFGRGGLLALSCLATAGRLLGDSVAPGWWLVVPLGVLAGLGAGAIDSGWARAVSASRPGRFFLR